MVEQLKRTAIKESESIVSTRSSAPRSSCPRRASAGPSSANEIREQRHLRQRLEADLRRTLESYGKLIDAFATADHPDGE